MLARIARPKQARRRAAPSSTRIDSTSSPQRISPPCEAIRLARPVDERARAAHGEMHAPAFFQEGDQAIDRAGAKRVAADEQGMKAEDGAQPLVAKVFRHETIDAAVAFEPDEMASDARHVGERTERSVAELLEPDAVDVLASAHEAFEACDVSAGLKRATSARIAASSPLIVKTSPSWKRIW